MIEDRSFVAERLILYDWSSSSDHLKWSKYGLEITLSDQLTRRGPRRHRHLRPTSPHLHRLRLRHNS